MAFGYKVYFTERSRNRVVCFDPDSGATQVVAGEPTEGEPAQRLRQPYGLVVDRKGEVLVADKHNHRICAVKAGRIEPHVIGGGDSPDWISKLVTPTGLCVEPATGALLCSFSDSHCICRIEDSGRVSLVLGRSPETRYCFSEYWAAKPPHEVYEAPIRHPAALVRRRDGTLFFVERGCQVVREFHPERGIRTVGRVRPANTLLEVWPSDEIPCDEFQSGYPTGLALDDEEHLYISDAEHGAVFRLNNSNGTVRKVLSIGRGGPSALCFGPDRSLWILNSHQGAVQAYRRSANEQFSEQMITMKSNVGEINCSSQEGCGISCPTK